MTLDHADGKLSVSRARRIVYLAGKVLLALFAALMAIGSLSTGLIAASIAFVLLLLIVAPVVALENLLSRYGVKGRMRIGLAFALFVIAIVVLGQTGPKVKTQEAKTLEKSEPPAAPPAVAALPPAAAPEPPISSKADFLAMYGSVLSAVAPCDVSNSRAADTLASVSSGRASTVDAFTEAQTAQRDCETAWVELGKIDAPDSIEGEASETLGKTLENCENAYWLRKKSLETMMTVIDGDARPSVIADFKEKAEAAQSGQLACVAGLWTSGSKLGVTAAELKAAA